MPKSSDFDHKEDKPMTRLELPIRRVEISGRTFGYNCIAYRIGSKVFCWLAIKQYLAAWAIGFEIADRTLILFLGPFAVALGLIDKGNKTNV